MSNLDILDQRVEAAYNQYSTQIAELLDLKLPNDMVKIRSICFVFVVAQTLLDLTDEQALESLTDGFSDFRIDAIHPSQ
ncbi:MAG: abortive phage resistance protein, partial [Bacteroidota bacterium]